MANDKHLYELDELTTPQSNDLVMVEQASNNKDMKVKMENFMPADTIASAVNTYLDGHSGYYVIPDGNVTMDKLATDVHQKFATKADIDGYYDEMSVGSAEQLLSNTYIPDNTPYLFRTSGGSLEIGDRVYEDAIVGGSVAWNQVVSGSNTVSSNGVTFNDGVFHYQKQFTSTESAPLISSISVNSSHKYFFQYIPIRIVEDYGYMRMYSGDYFGSYFGQERYETIKIPSGSTLALYQTNTLTSIEYNKDFYFNAYDLTLMFGSTIADYIYSLEQSEAGSGIAWLKSYGFFTKDYYAYDVGGIQSVKTSAKKTVGFNQWDEEWELGYYGVSTGNKGNASNQIRSKNYIPVLPNTSYFRNTAKGYICQYDANKVFIVTTTSTLFTTSANTYYITLSLASDYGTTYNNDICINLHWDGERDGEYEPYVEHTYPLDSDLELRGIPKLDSSNKLYYDGDTYASDGTVTRRYGIVDLGTLNYTRGNFNNIDYFSTTSTSIPNIKKPASITLANNICSKYIEVQNSGVQAGTFVDKSFFVYTNGSLYIRDDSYTDAATFKTAMSGQYLVYELATATSESADPYTNPQIVSNWGTEEFVDTRDVPVPVGHDSRYLPDLRAKLESAPNNPSTNGKYFLQYENGQATYVPVPSEVPQTPSEDGTYILKATVASGTATLAWVAEE